MTLKEKFKNILIDWIDEYYNREHIAEVIEIDADNYAIDFLEWCENKNVFSPSVIHKPTYNKLLIQFKKEKGL
jgi:hypothetical protein